MTSDPLKELISKLENELRGDSAPSGYDLRDPIIRTELLEQPLVHFKLSALPAKLQMYVDGLKGPATETEEELICDFLDRAFDLKPRYCTVMILDSHEIWVTQTEEETRKRRLEQRATRTSTNDLPATTYELHQLNALHEHIKKGSEKGQGQG